MDQTSHIRVLIADDQAMIRAGWSALLAGHPDLRVVGSVGTGEEALASLRELDGAVDVALLDVEMPGMGGIAATQQIHQTWPNCAVLLLTSHEQFSDAGVRAGARGYLLKDAEPDELLAGIRAVARGTMYLQAWNGANDTRLLSDTEQQILELVALSATNYEIGQQTGYAESTVRAHVATIVKKLGANGREHAIYLAMRQGLLH